MTTCGVMTPGVLSPSRICAAGAGAVPNCHSRNAGAVFDCGATVNGFWLPVLGLMTVTPGGGIAICVFVLTVVDMATSLQGVSLSFVGRRPRAVTRPTACRAGNDEVRAVGVRAE